MTGPLPLPGGGWVVPGNRWDLLPSPPEPAPEVSVVVTHFESQGGLDLVLAALTGQTHPRTRLQVVVSDDGSARPPDLSAGAELGATLVRQENRGFRAAAARNLGAAATDGQVLVFLDADTIPEPDYLARLTRLPAVLPDALVGGRRRHADLTGWTPPRWREWMSGQAPGPVELTEPAWLRDAYARTGDLLRPDPRNYRFLISATMACSRRLFTEIGGFDASMVGYGGEDWDLAFRAENAGAVLAHRSDAVAWHDGPEWAERDMPDEVRWRNKTIETLALARRIPEPGARGRGRIFEVPDLLAALDVTGWPTASAVLTVQTVLAAGDVQIVVSGDGAAELQAEFAPDPRVRTDDPPDHVQDRVRATLQVLAPLRGPDPARAWSGLTDRLHREGLARLTVADENGPLAVLTARRAERRAQRWATELGRAAPDLAELLFGAETIFAQVVGLTRLSGEPSLAAVYGGWG